MDRIIESLVNDYLISFNITTQSESIDFEKFSCFCVMSREYSETFDIDDVIVGESPGIDGLGIIVNGRLIDSIEEVDDLRATNKYIEVIFVFIQSKSSEHFDGGDIGTFGNAVLDTFHKKQHLTHNDIILRKIKVINHIIDNCSPAMTRGKPICKLYYACTGKWTNDVNLQGRFESIKIDLLDKKIFDEVEIVPLGAQEVQKLYMGTKMAISAEIVFQYKVAIPRDIKGVEEAHVGILPYEEFRKIIIDEVGNIKPIFYDNVRAFQGENDVNREIQQTIRSDKLERFPVLNNGITIVAKELTIIGNKATIKDYQIVNGCQTSHVIFNNRETDMLKDLWVPIKIIVTKDENVVNDIIKATNNQTQIKPEQLAALSQFQKDLELYFQTYKDKNELFYERRSKQYATQPGISKTKIITIPTQIKAFAAMYLGMPHKVSRYYGTIVQDIGGDIFSPTQQLISYYTSALAYYKLECLFRSGDIDPKYKKCRFHILFALTGIVMGFDLPPLNSKEVIKRSNKLIDVLSNDNKCLTAVNKAVEYIDKLKIDIKNRDTFKVQSLTDKLKKLISKKGVK